MSQNPVFKFLKNILKVTPQSYLPNQITSLYLKNLQLYYSLLNDYITFDFYSSRKMTDLGISKNVSNMKFPFLFHQHYLSHYIQFSIIQSGSLPQCSYAEVVIAKGKPLSGYSRTISIRTSVSLGTNSTYQNPGL